MKQTKWRTCANTPAKASPEHPEPPTLRVNRPGRLKIGTQKALGQQIPHSVNPDALRKASFKDPIQRIMTALFACQRI